MMNLKKCLTTFFYVQTDIVSPVTIRTLLMNVHQKKLIAINSQECHELR